MKKIKIVATIEARMNSVRLPGKVMKKFGKHPMLGVLIDRLIKSKKIDDIVVATSKSKKDNKIVSFLKKKNINFYRGSENNVNSDDNVASYHIDKFSNTSEDETSDNNDGIDTSNVIFKYDNSK